MICRNCPRFTKINNTDTCGIGLCTYLDSFFEVGIDDSCIFVKDKYTCGDCDHYRKNDPACFTCRVGDEVGDCSGFVDANESVVYEALTDWALRDMDYEAKITSIVNKFKAEFEKPF